ncbi:MAG: hypothetical protein JW891_00575, partial [Candidatus Lokiarchaeota archaeon]|nr:hypothetical protein [Candidatus Lokiarchaeota archaeon]
MIGIWIDFLLVIVGIAMIVIAIVMFNPNIISIKERNFYFKIPSKQAIKALILLLICISQLILPLYNPITIISWAQVGFLSYARAIICIISLGYLPGACIYDIFFSNNKTHEKISQKFGLYKFTLYPLISFSFMGTCVLILDQANLTINAISTGLILSIFILFLIDLVKNHNVSYFLKKRKKEIHIERTNVQIIIFLLGFLFLLVGIQVLLRYLLLNDSWPSIYPGLFIGRAELSPFEDMNNYRTYPFFWGYISYGLSALSG